MDLTFDSCNLDLDLELIFYNSTILLLEDVDILLELLIIYSWIIGKTHGWAIISVVIHADREFWKSDTINCGYFNLGTNKSNTIGTIMLINYSGTVLRSIWLNSKHVYHLTNINLQTRSNIISLGIRKDESLRCYRRSRAGKIFLIGLKFCSHSIGVPRFFDLTT